MDPYKKYQAFLPGFTYPQQCYPQKGFYFIKSKSNGLVLDIEGANKSPKTRVLMWHQKNVHDQHEIENQLFYDDLATGTIRCKLSNMCLHENDNGVLVVNTFIPGEPRQLWERYNLVIRNRQFPQRVLEITGGRLDSSATLGAQDFNGGQHQLFECIFIENIHDSNDEYAFKHLNTLAAMTVHSSPEINKRREFFIGGRMHNKVLDIKGGSMQDGAPIIMYDRHATPQKNQLWYLDQEGHIRSAMNDFMMCSNGLGQTVQTGRYDPYGSSRYFQILGDKIYTNQGDLLDVRGDPNLNCAEVITNRKRGNSNQSWKISYL